MSWADRRYASGGGMAFPVWTDGVRLLIIINVVVALVNLVLGGDLSRIVEANAPSQPGWAALSAAGLLDGLGLGVVRLLTYQFVHAFSDPFHLLFNMLFLYIFGTMVEPALGKRGIIKLYLLSGLLGGIMFMVLAAVIGKTAGTSVVGASGCVYGVMVYAACVAPQTTILLFFVIPIKLWLLVSVIVFLGVWYQVMDLHGYETGSVAHSAHLGGALWGFLAFKLDRSSINTSRWNPFRKLQGWQQDRDVKTQQKQQAVLDEILEKIHREGMNALTAAERRFLEKASKNRK